MSLAPQLYNLRVYGIVLRDREVLLSEEFRMGMHMTKFPGGGVEPGEGILDALFREFQEEMGITPTSAEHFYTTDFYLESAFQPGVQLISIYYLVTIENTNTIPEKSDMDSKPFPEGSQDFRWARLSDTHVEAITFPVDKLVFQLLRDKYLRILD